MSGGGEGCFFLKNFKCGRGLIGAVCTILKCCSCALSQGLKDVEGWGSGSLNCGWADEELKWGGQSGGKLSNLWGAGVWDGRGRISRVVNDGKRRWMFSTDSKTVHTQALMVEVAVFRIERRCTRNSDIL